MKGIDADQIEAGEYEGLSETEFRLLVRSRFTELEIDLILDLVSRVPVAIWAASGQADNFAVRLWSPGAEKIYGFRKDEILGKNYIETFVNRLERTQGIFDHKKLEHERRAYRNLARDQHVDQSTRLMLTQGVALWNPILKHFMQGEMTVDATEVPGKDRDWLEQVLTPESMQVLLRHFTEMTHAAFLGVDHVLSPAQTLVKTFMGENADLIVFVERPGTQMMPVGSSGQDNHCEFDPRAIVRWCMNVDQPVLIVDYSTRRPPSGAKGSHGQAFPKRRGKEANPARFAVRVVKDENGIARGGIFMYSNSDTLSRLTESLLAAISGTVQLALAIEDRIAETARAQSVAAKERERKATIILARQYRHAVRKKADLLDFLSGLLRETPDSGEVTKIADALESMSENLVRMGNNFETELREEIFNLGDLLSAVTGSIIDTYPAMEVVREPFGYIPVRGVRPFVESAFENLLVNAVEAQAMRGRVGVQCRFVAASSRNTPSTVDVFVCDDGAGLNSEIRECINRGGQITTKAGDGGLGLVITRSTIRECGGELEALDCSMEGWKGACFKVSLPKASV